VREYLEKEYKEGLNPDQTLKLAVEGLMEVVESAKNMEIAVLFPGKKYELLEEAKIEAIVKQIEKEREEAQKQ